MSRHLVDVGNLLDALANALQKSHDALIVEPDRPLVDGAAIEIARGAYYLGLARARLAAAGLTRVELDVFPLLEDPRSELQGADPSLEQRN